MSSQYSTNEFKAGLKVLFDGKPCSIISNEFVKPGKGQAFNRVALRDLLTGRVVERTFKSGETLPGADVVQIEVQYLYNDGSVWYFMDTASYEQYSANETAMVEAKKWLKGQEVCSITLFNGSVLNIDPPIFVLLKVAETDPGLRGDTSSGGSKQATLETGAVIRIPLFIQSGELVKVDTRTGDYVSRAKET